MSRTSLNCWTGQTDPLPSAPASDPRATYAWYNACMRIVPWSVVLLICASCGNIPNAPLPSEFDHGLIVIYPGASSVPLEESFWLLGLRAAGIDQAVDG